MVVVKQSPIRILFVYAFGSEDDTQLQGRLQNHLLVIRNLTKEYRFSHWDIFAYCDPQQSGQKSVSSQIEESDIVLVLVSADSDISSYLDSNEMKYLNDKSKNGKVRRFLVLLRDCYLQSLPLDGLEVLPGKNEAIKRQPSLVERRLTEVVDRVMSEAKDLLKRDYIEQIDKLREPDLQQEEFDEILLFYDEILRLFPDDAAIYKHKGDFLQSFNRYKEALQAYTEATKHNPNDPQSFIGRGDMLRKLKHPDEEAVKDYLWAQYLSHNGRPDPIVSAQLSLRFISLGHFDEGLEECKRAIDQGFDDVQVYAHKGFAHLQCAEFDAANQAYDLALKREGKSALPFVRRGSLASAAKEIWNALDAYSKALIYEPKNYFLWRGKGVVLGELQLWPEAKDAYDEVVKLIAEGDPVYPFVHKELADILYNLQHYGQALSEYNTVIKLQPKLATAYIGRANIYEKIIEQRNQEIKDLQQEIKDLQQMKEKDLLDARRLG